MIAHPTPWLLIHALIAVGGLISAVLLRAPALVVLASPSVVLLAIDIAWRPDPRVEVRLSTSDRRLIAGGSVDVIVDVIVAVRATLEVSLQLPRLLEPEGPTAWTVTLCPSGHRELRVTATAVRWGAAELGPVHLRWSSPGRLLEVRRTAVPTEDLRVLPRTAAASRLVTPTSTHQAAGNRTARERGSGTDFADVRPFLPGDRARDVNWRVSARRGAPWMTERHAERRTDVVLLLDAYGGDHLGEVLRGAREVAQGYLGARDRVGVTALGGVLRWVEPGTGIRQEHVIADALMDGRVTDSAVVPSVASLPPGALPPGALIIGLTAGIDRRLADVAVGLRARGRDVVVLILEPALPPSDDEIERLTDRLVRLQRRAVRDRLHAHAVPAVAWDPSDPVDTALTELQRWRRRHVTRSP